MALPRKIRVQMGKRKKLIGALGEALVVKHLLLKGFKHIESNFLRRQGELDLVMEFNGIIHFIEVKTVSRERSTQLHGVRGITSSGSVIRETGEDVNRETSHMPEENVSRWKMRKISKAVQIYIDERKLYEQDWQFDVAVVYLVLKERKAYIKLIKDIPLEA